MSSDLRRNVTWRTRSIHAGIQLASRAASTESSRRFPTQHSRSGLTKLTSCFLWCSYLPQLTVMRTLFYTLYLPARLTPGSGGIV